MLDKRKKWFQLSQRQRLSPFPNYISMESICHDMKKVIGYAYQQVVTIFRKNVTHVYIDKDDHAKVGRAISKKVIARPDIFIALSKKQKEFARSFYRFLKKNNNPNQLKKISDNKLASLHEEYERRYRQVYSYYFPILAIEIYFFEYLRDYLNSKEKDTVKATRYLGIFITERKAMVNRQEKVAALKLGQRIKRNKKWLRYFRSSNPEKTIELVKDDKILFKLIKSHEKKFFWITRDYDDPILTFKDFITRFKKHLQGNPTKELKKLQHEEDQLKKDIKNISKKLNIDKKHQRLFQTMREGIYYKELRKWIVSQTLYYYDPILMEIARRGGLSLNQARHLMTREVRSMLTKNIEMGTELNQRIKLSVFHNIQGKSKVYIGKEAQKYYDYFVKVNKKAKILYGMPVSAGKVKGPVKIVINPDSFHKVKKGDIIVTLQATPVFSPVLAIASGLICDGGPGITAHPATLAREAGIPGIIALRMATKILKDGQIVEVDGDKGIVKLIK